MRRADHWRRRRFVLQAMAFLCLSRTLVAIVPLRWWRRTLGFPGDEVVARAGIDARYLADRVDQAAAWLPFKAKCLPRAIALSWLLRRYRAGHCLVIAVRPSGARTGEEDMLHAWVESHGSKWIGDLPGPWVELQRFAG